MKNKSKIKKNNPQGFTDGRTRLNLLAQFRNWGKNFTDKSQLIVADMQLNTGDVELHVVEVSKKTFKLFGKRYIVNPEYLQYNRTLQMHVGKYHEGLSLPLNMHVDVNAVKSAVKNNVVDGSKEADVVTNLDPEVLESLVTTTIVQKVFAGAEMQDLFGLLKVLMIIGLLIGAVTLVVVLGTSGLF